MIEAAIGQKRGARSSRASVRLAARALRVRQWPKNLLLFAGLLFAAKLGDSSRWADACLAVAAYCAASSAAYLVNDVHDVARDRLHPTKRLRPVASGRLSIGAALWAAVALAIAALASTAALGIRSLVLLLAFFGLQLLYSFRLKRIVGLDVLTIAGLFTLRAAAGAEAVHVRVSTWLLACTALLALFLALAKRRGELRLESADVSRHRPVLALYSTRIIDRLLVVAAAGAAGSYTAYTLSARDSYEMVITVPLVLAAILRYFVLVHRQGLGEEPEEILLRDRPMLLAITAWAVTAGLVLMSS